MPDDRSRLPLANVVVLGSALLVAVAAVQRYTHVLPGSKETFHFERERCYGIAKAGRNDCGTARHACAAQARLDRQPDEWISVPAGTCARIAGGETSRPPGA